MFMKKSFYTALCVSVLLIISACGGGSSSPESEVGGETGDGMIVERISAVISTDTSTYEFSSSPEVIVVTAVFGEDISNVSTSSLDATNATVNSLSPVSGEVYRFSVTPDGSNEDITLSIAADAVRTASGLGNRMSNSITIVGQDTLAPEVSLSYNILSYTTDSRIRDFELEVLITENISSFSEENITLKNAEILEFFVDSERNYRAVLRSLGLTSEIEAEIASASFTDDAGNPNELSNLIRLSSAPVLPESVSGLNISTGLKSLTLSWNESLNTTYYQVMQGADTESNFVQIGENIPASADLSYSIEDLSLYKKANKVLAVYACNIAGCSESDAVPVLDKLWDAVGYLKAPKSFGGQAFGNAVAISSSGSVMAVGAVNDALENSDPYGEQVESLYRAGSVYMYRKIDGQWQYEALIQSPNRERGDAFGHSISLNESGTVLAVGAPTEDGLPDNQSSNVNEESGAVYIYHLNEGEWRFESYLKTSNGNTSDFFGSKVSLDAEGDTLAIAASGKEDDSDSFFAAGAVYIYEFEESAWSQSAFIRSPNQGDRFYFGNSIDINAAGTTLVVGMPNEGIPESGRTWVGSAYIYELHQGSWDLSQKLIPNIGGSDISFGLQVSIDDLGNTIAIGAPREDEISTDSEDTGVVYIYKRGSSDDFSLHTKLAPSNPVDFINFGEGVALSGAGKALIVSSNEYSQWDRGFYLEESPNDNRPFSSQAHYIFELQDDTWNAAAFIKGWSSGDNALAIDFDADNVLFGGYGDNQLIDGYQAMGDFEFDPDFSVDNPATASLTGAVIVF